MNKLFYLIIFFFILGCSNNKSTYWCGDHPCINNKEKEDYFKKTMIVEVKEFKKENDENNSEIEKIMRQVRKKEKRRIKEEKDLAQQVKLEEKRRIKEEKDLAQQVKLEEKRRIKEEKDLEKKIEKNEETSIKKPKIIPNQNDKLSVKTNIVEIDSNKFSTLVNKILIKNSFKPFPNINDIPN